MSGEKRAVELQLPGKILLTYQVSESQQIFFRRATAREKTTTFSLTLSYDRLKLTVYI